MFGPVGQPTAADGGWQTLPHLASGHRVWREQMAPQAQHMSLILQAYGIPDIQCSLCPNARWWDEHIPASEHYKKVYTSVGDQRVGEARENLWQYWNVRSGAVFGRLRFNHVDGEAQMLRDEAPAGGPSPADVRRPMPPAAPPPPSPPPPPGAPPPTIAVRPLVAAVSVAAPPNEGLSEEDLPGFHLQEGDSAEVPCSGGWVRVVLMGKDVIGNVKAWRVLDYWPKVDAVQSVVPLRDICLCQDEQPSYSFKEGGQVSILRRGGAPVSATTVSRASLPNGRKAWRCRLDADGSFEVVELEKVLEPVPVPQPPQPSPAVCCAADDVNFSSRAISVQANPLAENCPSIKL
eukprot:NODE_5355_length_1780_cov_1.911071.p1 GENE.NODE_5355_length_1780_cov_1.911071~~NODE_5355_length_1780_cov_1.911071.p1  ORF type:complete len:348 (-),score=60.98 NODE_5355_length_1780_cov_1.911071:49-1092(-)